MCSPLATQGETASRARRNPAKREGCRRPADAHSPPQYEDDDDDDEEAAKGTYMYTASTCIASWVRTLTVAPQYEDDDDEEEEAGAGREKRLPSRILGAVRAARRCPPLRRTRGTAQGEERAAGPGTRGCARAPEGRPPPPPLPGREPVLRAPAGAAAGAAGERRSSHARRRVCVCVCARARAHVRVWPAAVARPPRPQRASGPTSAGAGRRAPCVCVCVCVCE